MIYLELVPRQLNETLTESQQYLAQYNQITGINIPDIKRLSTRSYDIAATMLKQNIKAIPHIRTKDDSLDTHFERVDQLIELGLEKILLVSGDSHQDAIHDVSPVLLTKALKQRYKHLKVYTAIDPYRQIFEEEVRYAKEKIDAGSDGFFTQPFFEKDLCEAYVNQFKESDIYIGISPVLTQRSFDYWVSVNKVQFPENFKLDLSYNSILAKELLEIAEKHKQHAYIMPIKIDINAYLSSIFK